MRRLLCLILCLLAFPVAAEPALADLKAAFGKRAGTEPVSGELKVTVRHQLGKGDHADLREGQAQITVRADSTGLHWGYSPEALAQKQRERQKTVLDPSAATPLLTAQAELDLPAVARHVSAVGHLQHWVALSEYQAIPAPNTSVSLPVSSPFTMALSAYLTAKPATLRITRGSLKSGSTSMALRYAAKSLLVCLVGRLSSYALVPTPMKAVNTTSLATA